MLNYRINIKDNRNKVFKDLSVESNMLSLENGVIWIHLEGEPTLKINDEIFIERADGDLMFNATMLVKDAKITSDGWKFSIGEWKMLPLVINSLETITANPSPATKNVGLSEDAIEDAGLRDYITSLYNYYVVIGVTDAYKHPYGKNRTNFKINEYVYSDIENTAEGRRCDGDNVLYDDTFIHENLAVNENGEYIFPTDACSNIKKKVYFKDGSYMDVIVPMIHDGIDDRTRLFVPCDSEEDADEKREYLMSHPAFCVDERFFYDMRDIFHIEPNTKVYLKHDFITLELPTAQNIGLDLYREDNLQTFLENEKTKAKNSIVDYERRQFQPFYVNKNGEIKNASSINFNLHFRTRSNYDPDDSDSTWTTEETDLWNNYPTLINNSYLQGKKIDEKKYGTTTLSDSDADLLGSIGFTDEEVYNEAKCLEKSFLRLSFYDSKLRQEQNLLFYSTIFLDTTKLYSQYVKVKGDVSTQNIDAVNFQWHSGSEKNLSCTFGAHSKFNASGSSEGFYTYFFPNIINGTAETTLYMKAEFNHAKFGYTVPMTCPARKEEADKQHGYSLPISPLSKDFPVNYYRNGKIDMGEYYNDCYIEVGVDYDIETNQFRWWPKIAQDGSDIQINLYEPRINYGQEGPNMKRNDSVIPTLTHVDIEANFYISEAGTYHIMTGDMADFLTDYWILDDAYIASKEGTSLTFDKEGIYTAMFELRDPERIPTYLFSHQNTYCQPFITKLSFGSRVTRIPPNLASGQKQLMEVEFSENTKTIEMNAFSGCEGLLSIDLSKCRSLTKIGNQAFQSCKNVTSLQFPNVYTNNNRLYIGTAAFASLRKLKSLEIPDYTVIYRHAFSQCYKLIELVGLSDAFKNNTDLHWYYGNERKDEDGKGLRRNGQLRLGLSVSDVSKLPAGNDLTSREKCKVFRVNGTKYRYDETTKSWIVYTDDPMGFAPCIFKNCTKLKMDYLANNIKYTSLNCTGTDLVVKLSKIFKWEDDGESYYTTLNTTDSEAANIFRNKFMPSYWDNHDF